jgi:hypothetical protein
MCASRPRFERSVLKKNYFFLLKSIIRPNESMLQRNPEKISYFLDSFSSDPELDTEWFLRSDQENTILDAQHRHEMCIK